MCRAVRDRTGGVFRSAFYARRAAPALVLLTQIVMKTVVRSPPFCYNGRLFSSTRRRKPESTGREVSVTRPSVNEAERKRAR